MRLVPLSERRRVHLHDGVLHQRLGSHQLVIAGVVHDINDARLARLGCKDNDRFSEDVSLGWALPPPPPNLVRLLSVWLFSIRAASVSKILQHSISAERWCNFEIIIAAPVTHSRAARGRVTHEALEQCVEQGVSYLRIPMRSFRCRAAARGTSCSLRGFSLCGSCGDRAAKETRTVGVETRN